MIRDKPIPWMIHVGTGAQLDAHNMCCMKPTSGFNYGIEVPDEIWKMADQNAAVSKTTYVQRVDNNVALEEYLSKWRLTAPIAQLPNTWVVRPEIAEWSPYMAQTPNFNSPETIRVNR